MGFELHLDHEKRVAVIESKPVPIRTAHEIEAEEDKKLMKERERAIRHEDVIYKDVEIR